MQCKGVEDQAAIKETVHSMNRLGYPDLIVITDNAPAMSAFDAVLRKIDGTFWCQSNRASSTTIRFCLGRCGTPSNNEKVCELW